MFEKVYLIDSFAIFFKIYNGLKDPLLNRQDFPTNLITGFVKFLIALKKKKIDLSRVVFALEGEDNFRKKISKIYKLNREESEDNFKLQIPVLIDFIQKMGFPTPKIREYEADDVIGTLSKKYVTDGYSVYIISPDKDFIQLMSEDIYLCRDYEFPIKYITTDEVVKEFGVRPEQFIDFLAIVGDGSDNIKGVEGIGKVGAKELLTQFKNLDEIYNNLNKISKRALATKLENGRESAMLSKYLVTIKQDLNIEMPKLGKTGSEPFLKIVPELLEYEIYSAIDYLVKNKLIKLEAVENLKVNDPNFKFEAKIIRDIQTLKFILNSFLADEIVAFDTETIDTEFNSKIVGFSFARLNENNNLPRGYYVPIYHQYLGAEPQISKSDIKNMINMFNEFKLIGHNSKFDKHIVFSNFDVELKFISDTMILAWLNDSEDSLSLDNLSYTYLKHKKIKYKDLVPTGSNFSDTEIEVASRYAVEDVIATLKLYKYFNENLDKKMLYLEQNLEMKISEIIFKMEKTGIAVDLKYLAILEKEYLLNIKNIAENICVMVGADFNLNSPKQVAEILYDKLKIDNKSRSTDEENLNKIKDKHKVVPEILKYRELHKLVSTYITPMIKFGNESKYNRISSQFNQTGTITGRFSSQDPNLQNIPVNSGIRNIFIAKEGFTLISFDYSQIELRFLAHYSEDEILINAFKNNLDIHSVVAEKLKIDRAVAKTVNFGLIYGMGARKLAETIFVTDEVAKKIINEYFQEFVGVKNYRELMSHKLELQNYVETIFGRRRYFVKPKHDGEQASFDREAFNTIFQGSSADLIKLAMVNIDNYLSTYNIEANLLLQIHDELIFEVKDSQLEKVKNIFSKIMNQVLTLKVPLTVGLKTGKSWGELK